MLKFPPTASIFRLACLLLLVVFISGCTAIGSAKPAALQVTSQPEASVFLDGKHLGKTPFFSDQLKAGDYLVKITSGEASYVEKIKLTESTLTVINRTLNNNFLAQSGEVLWLEPGQKGLFVISMPASANLSVDGQKLGTTPLKIDQIAEGEHKLVLTKDGYLEREFAIKSANGYQLLASVTLASQIAKEGSLLPSPLPVPAKVEITATPQGFLRVRAQASTDSSEIGRVATGDQLEVIQEVKDWVQVKFEGKQGWVASLYTQKVPGD